MHNNQPAIFLDRDGTIIREAEYLADPAGVELLPGTVAGLRALQAAGYRLVVVSNQSGVARGFFDEATVRRVNQRMADLLAAEGIRLAGVYYCPHHPKGSVLEYARECECRKPGTKMLRQACQDLGIGAAQSWVIGDKDSDLGLGRQSGVRTILVLTGYGEKTRAAGFAPGAAPTQVAADLAAAAQVILAMDHKAEA